MEGRGCWQLTQNHCFAEGWWGRKRLNRGEDLRPGTRTPETRKKLETREALALQQHSIGSLGGVILAHSMIFLLNHYWTSSALLHCQLIPTLSTLLFYLPSLFIFHSFPTFFGFYAETEI